MPRSHLLVTALALVSACGTARVVYQSGNTGTIELSGDAPKAMVEANREMTTVCGANNASIVAQGYEPAATSSYDPPRGSAAPADPSAPHDGQVWRVHFQCGVQAATAPPAPPVAAPAPAL